jgi:hypothetical protein
VKFLFNRKGRLTAVTMSYAGEGEPTEQAFDELLALVLSKYGAANGSNPAVGKTVWTTTDRLLQASISNAGPGKREIVVTFMAPNTSEAAKL